MYSHCRRRAFIALISSAMSDKELEADEAEKDGSAVFWRTRLEEEEGGWAARVLMCDCRCERVDAEEDGVLELLRPVTVLL